MNKEQITDAAAGPVERRVMQPVFEPADCPKCGAYAPIETGVTNGQDWWEQYCDNCESSFGDVA